MANTLLGRVYQSSLDESYDYSTMRLSRSYSVTYLVRSTDHCADEATILATDGLPRVTEQSSMYPGTYVTGRSAFESTEGTGIWTVTITYETPAKYEGEGGGGEGSPSTSGDGLHDLETPPWLMPRTFSLGTIRKQSLKTHMVYLGSHAEEGPTDFTEQFFPWQDALKFAADAYGNRRIPVTNAAGEPIYFDGERILATITVTGASPDRFGYIRTIQKRLGTVNKNAFGMLFIEPNPEPGTLLCDDLTATSEHWQDPSTGFYIPYYSYSVKYVYDPLGHWVEFANVGNYYFPGGRTYLSGFDIAIRSVGADSEPVIANLDNAGGFAADGAAPLFLRYCPFPIIEWPAVI